MDGRQGVNAGAVVRANPYNSTADGLLLAGGIVGLVFSILGLLMALIQFILVSAFADAFSQAGGGAFFPPFTGIFAFMFLFMLIGVALGVAGAVMVFQGRARLRASGGSDGKSTAIVGAALLLAGFNLVAGGLALVGALIFEAGGERRPGAR